MTADQFASLARLMRLRTGSPSSAGLRLVLVDGLTHQAAADASGAQRASVTRLVTSARACVADAQTLAGVVMPAAREI